MSERLSSSPIASGPDASQPSTLEIIDPREALEILAQTEIHADPFNGRSLTTEIIIGAGLEPKYRISLIPGVVLLSSKPYELDKGRIAVMAYMQYAGKIVARTFYRSNSAGLWRYLPGYKTDGKRVTWFDKGIFEERITLPSISQKAFAKISEQEPAIKVSDPDLVFAGTTRLVEERKEVTSFHRDINFYPVQLEGNFASIYGKVPPAEVEFSDPGERPNFNTLLDHWEQESSLYGGKISVELFRSHNGRFSFMFCRDKVGRVWVGGVESEGEIRTTGLRDQWVSAPFLTTPAFEYASMSEGYGNPKLRSGEYGEYIDMFENYLSKIPIIQEYLTRRGLGASQ